MEQRESELVGETNGPAQDAVEFERLLRDNQRLVYRIAFGVLADQAEAQDVTQEVFLQAYRKISSLRDAGKFRAWVARMSWRLALNRQRAVVRARRRDTSWWEWSTPPQASAESLAASGELHSRLHAEIGRLPQKLRGALLLSALEELTTREIAEVLQIPEGTVRSRLHLARKKLLGLLSHERV